MADAFEGSLNRHSSSSHSYILAVYLQLVRFVTADYNVQPIPQRPELAWNTLPSLPTHDHSISRSLGRAGGDLRKISHFLGQPPWETRALTDAIRYSGSDDECESGHGLRLSASCALI